MSDIPEIEIRDLNAKDKADLATLQQEFNVVEGYGETYHRARALNFRSQHNYVSAIGRANLETHGEKVMGWETKSRSLVYGFAASIVTGVNIYAATNEKDKTKRHNRVAPVAKMLAALPFFREEHEKLSDEKFIEWYDDNSRFDGIFRRYQEATKAPAKDAAGEQEGKVDDIIASMLTNPAGFEVAQNLGLGAGTVSIFVAQGEGDKARLVPLDVTPAFVASLAGNAPDPLTKAPADLLFWRQLVRVGETIIPDSMSDQPRNAIAADDEVNSSTSMLPSNAMFLIRGGKFSVASARDKDTLVLEVEPGDDVAKSANLPLDRDGFINNRSRRVTSARLIAPKTCVGFIPSKDGKTATKVTSEDGKTTVSFKHKETRLNSNLVIAPCESMGSVWTYAVSRKFSGAVFCRVTGQIDALEKQTLAEIHKSKRNLPVTITVGEHGISFANGKATVGTFAGHSAGSASVKVDRGDFLRAVSGLLATVDVTDLAWGLDPEGLLAIEARTEAATYRVFVQTLREDGGRHRTLLDLVNAG